MQLSPSTQHPTRQNAGLCRYPWRGRRHPMQLHAESGDRRRPDHSYPQWWYRRLRYLGVLDIQGASCRQDSKGKVEWRYLGHQRNCSAVGPQKVQSTSRYPHTVRLRYNAVPLWNGKKSALTLLEINIPNSRSSARTAWRDPPSAPRDSIHIPLTHLRTEDMYNNEWRTSHFYHGHKKPRHWSNFHRPMPTCSCMCSELIFRKLTWNWHLEHECVCSGFIVSLVACRVLSVTATSMQNASVMCIIALATVRMSGFINNRTLIRALLVLFYFLFDTTILRNRMLVNYTKHC